MGVISDAIDSLQEWCENLFKDGIKSQFDSISDLMTETFHKTTEDGGLISTFLTGHPASFSGSASGGTTIWSTIETLCNNVVVPIGGFILVIILLNDLIQTVIREITSRILMIPSLSNGLSKPYAVSFWYQTYFTSHLPCFRSEQTLVPTVLQRCSVQEISCQLTWHSKNRL